MKTGIKKEKTKFYVPSAYCVNVIKLQLCLEKLLFPKPTPANRDAFA